MLKSLVRHLFEDQGYVFVQWWNFKELYGDFSTLTAMVKKGKPEEGRRVERENWSK